MGSMDESKPDVFFMVDIEASGPIPGDYSMLSLGAVIVGQHTPPYHKSFYVEIKPLPGAKDELEAMRVNGLDLSELEREGLDPNLAMTKFRQWVIEQADPNIMRPVMVSNGTFDYMFVTWYFHHFHVRSPFTVNSLDCKSFYLGMNRTVRWGQTSARSIKARHPEWFSNAQKHNHNALDDALGQAEWFHKMRQS